MKLEKVIKYKKGKSPQKGQNDENLILYLTPEYLRGNSTPNFIPDFSTKVEVLDGDLLLLWDGSNAGEFFKGKKGILSSTMVKFEFNKFDYNSDFLFYQLKAFESYLKAQTNGSGIPHVDKEILLGLEIENFEKPEQTRIAEILSTADEAIAHTEALIAKYQRIKTGLMQDLLTCGIDENGNIRSKATHKFVVKNGVEVPEEWEVKQIEEVAILKSGGTPSRQNLSFWNGDTPWVKTGEINYEIICKTEESITEKGLTNSSAVLFPKDTILMALYGQGKTRGRVGILGIDASTNQACIGFLNLKGITRDFLYITLTNEYENLRELSNDGAQKNLSASLLNKYKIKVPSDIDEQKRIDSVFLEIDNLINEQKNNLAKLQSLKTGLMQDLLSGKVRVNMNNKN